MYRNLRTVLMIMTLIFVMGAGTTFADESKLPDGDNFHIDLRSATLFSVRSEMIKNEDTDDELQNGYPYFGFGVSGAGMKLGYLIGQHHDVGGHILLEAMGETTNLNPDEDGKNGDRETSTAVTRNRIAAYYNYNFRPNTWVMPYLGPVAGLDTYTYTFKVVDDDDSEVMTTSLSPFLGLEGGVRLFPMKNVAFDIAAITTAGPSGRWTEYEDSRLEDETWEGISVEFGVHAGVSIFF